MDLVVECELIVTIIVQHILRLNWEEYPMSVDNEIVDSNICEASLLCPLSHPETPGTKQRVPGHVPVPRLARLEDTQ